VTPASAEPGARITLVGTGFTAVQRRVMSVRVGPSARFVRLASDTRMMVDTSANAPLGPAVITVEFDPGGRLTLANRFTFRGPAAASAAPPEAVISAPPVAVPPAGDLPDGDEPPPALPQENEPCDPAKGCAGVLSCKERFSEAQGKLISVPGPSTGQRGPINAEDKTFEAAVDCPPNTRREGAPRGNGSSNTTCTALWSDSNPTSCRMQIHWSHGYGRWHCNIVYDVREVVRSSSGFFCRR
jgi:hypothetical protein